MPVPVSRKMKNAKYIICMVTTSYGFTVMREQADQRRTRRIHEHTAHQSHRTDRTRADPDRTAPDGVELVARGPHTLPYDRVIGGDPQDLYLHHQPVISCLVLSCDCSLALA